jgi:hypothetical protein
MSNYRAIYETQVKNQGFKIVPKLHKPQPIVLGDCEECGKLIKSTDNYYTHPNKSLEDGQIFCSEIHCIEFLSED